MNKIFRKIGLFIAYATIFASCGGTGNSSYIGSENSSNISIEGENIYTNDYIRAKDYVVWNTEETFDVEETLIIKYDSKQVDVTGTKKYNLNTNITIINGYRILWYKDAKYSLAIGTQQEYLKYGDNIFFATIVNESGQFMCAYAINIYVRNDYTYTFYEYQPNFALGTQMGKYKEIEVTEDDVISPIENPKNGYTFKGWVTYQSSTGQYQDFDFNTPSSSDLAIYATYEDEIIDFKVDGLSNVIFKPYLTSKLDVLSSQKGHFFDGYWSNGEQYFDAEGQATKPLPYSALKGLQIEYSDTTPETYFEFSNVADGYSIKLKNKPSYGIIMVPSTYNGKNVVEIGDSAFKNYEELKSIEIPETIQRIGNQSFSGCSSLASITIPNRVTSIGDGAFEGCRCLISIVIPNNVTRIGSRAFSGCISLTIYCEASSKPSGWDSAWNPVSRPVYWGMNENNYLIQDGLVYQIVDAKAVVIGYTNEASSDIVIPKTITIKETTYDVTSIGEMAFSGCNSVNSMEIANSVTRIENFAFENCHSLVSITIPNSVTKIGLGAFFGCNSLASIKIPNCVTSIGENAFANCSSLTSITFEEGSELTSILRNVFEGCDSLQYHEYGNCYYLGNETNPYLILVKVKNKSITEATISSNTMLILDHAFESCRSLTSIVIPSSVTNIGDYAFQDCRSLSSITFEEGSRLTSIVSNIFSGCDSLQYKEYFNCSYLGNEMNPYFILVKAKKTSITKLTIHANTRIIMNNAFLNCSSLISTVIPSSVTSLGESTFYGCSKLVEVVFEEGSKLTSIGWGAFYSCSSLASIVIPSSVTNMESDVFSDCTSLTIYCEVTSRPSEWDDAWNHDGLPVYWGSEWSYVNGIPTPNNK